MYVTCRRICAVDNGRNERRRTPGRSVTGGSSRDVLDRLGRLGQLGHEAARHPEEFDVAIDPKPAKQLAESERELPTVRTTSRHLWRGVREPLLPDTLQ